MKTLRRLIPHAALYALFIAWQSFGQAWAGNVLVFVLWFGSVLLTLSCAHGLAAKDIPAEKPRAPVGVFMLVGLMLAMAGVGHVWLSAAMCVAILAMLSYRRRVIDAQG